MPGLLAAVVEVFGKFAIKEKNCFAHSHSVLCAAEAKHINAALPGQFRGRVAKAGAGVRETRSIHMQPEPMFLANSRQSTQILHVVNAACFGGLTDGYGARFRVVNVLPVGRDLVNGQRREFAVLVSATKSLEPLEKNSGAPHSSVSTWAD